MNQTTRDTDTIAQQIHRMSLVVSLIGCVVPTNYKSCQDAVRWRSNEPVPARLT
jgi:hypothetical protein